MTPIFSAAYYFCLLSLAWIPLTAGFIGKFLVLLAGAGVAKWLLAIVLVLSSVIGLYYYLRLIVVMIRPGDESQKDNLPAPVYGRIWIGGSLVLFVLILLILWLGVFPQGVWDLIAGLKIA